MIESGLVTLRGTRLTDAERLATMTMLSGYVRNWALLTGEIATAAAASGATADEALAGYTRTLLALVAGRFPETAAVMAAGDPATEPPDFDFEFGLARQLDGIESLMGSRP